MQSDQHNDSVLGLVLQLQKLGIGNINGESMSPNTILGHYDSLKISTVTRWLDFSPRVDWTSVDFVNQSNSIVTHYPIKLIFPALQQKCQYPPLHYEEWKDCENMLGKNPCMALVLLKLTDAYKATVGNHSLQSFLELIKKHFKNQELKKVHFCVLPSLGYSDFCILMASNGWKAAMNIVEKLHGLTANNVAVLSTDYMIPVFHYSNKGVANSAVPFSDTELSVRINLQPGTTIQHLEASLPDKIQIYRTSGGSDYLLQAVSPPAQRTLLSSLLADNPSNVILDIASTLRVPIVTGKPKKNSSGKCLIEYHSSENLSQAYMVDGSCSCDPVGFFRSAVMSYRDKLAGKERHLRHANALLELAATTKNVCSQPHTGSLQLIMKGLLDNFGDCLKRCVIGMDRQDWPFEEMETQINALCNVISSFILDLSRSDCFYIEREKYTHTSISSVASLLIAYNCLLNDFTDDVRRFTSYNLESDYAFLVTSGGQDRTQTFDAFSFLKGTEIGQNTKERIPLIIQMSEMSLFDFSGTILRSIHECMHYCGNRFREERMSYLIKFLSSIFSDKLVEALFCEVNLLEDAASVFHTLSPGKKASELEDDLEDNIKSYFKEQKEKFRLRIQDRLGDYMDPGSSFVSYSDYLSVNVLNWIHQKMMEAFSGYFFNMETHVLAPNHLAAEVYRGYIEATMGFWKECDSLARKEGIETAFFAFKENQYRVYQQNGREYLPILQTIQIIFSRLLISDFPEAISSLPGDEEEKYRIWINAVPYITLADNNIVSVIDTAGDIFSEAFADVMACKILNVGIEDYLLMHVYEDWDIEFSLEEEMANCYRIPAVLQTCFPIDLDSSTGVLTDAAKARVIAAYNQLVKHGMPPYRNKAQELCAKVDSLLKAFQTREHVSKSLLDYLDLCITEYSNLGVWEKMKDYADLFEKVRLYSIVPNHDGTNRELVEMYYSLINWKGGKNDHVPVEMQQMASIPQPVHMYT